MSSCLLVVSHPDDDALFASQLQARLSIATWSIVCVPREREDERANELLAWQATLGTDPANVHFLGYPDDPEDWRQRRCGIEQSELESDLAGLSLAPDLVVTHNHCGEYGHPHHLATHRAVVRVYSDRPILVFGMGLDAFDLTLPCPDKPRTLRRFFPSQRRAIGKLARTRERFAWYRPASRPAPPLAADLARALSG